ncbi:MAG: tRNA (adenine-N1)-methyltransferase [Actinobacteria bacterium]|nr:tRNA (adenine-N1)-methyltransferase [Actinomycetota bacterium]
MSSPFAYGERVIIRDAKERRYLEVLKEGGEFHTHAGFIAHSAIVGMNEGAVLATGKGSQYHVLRPTLEDFVLEMPRGAQVIYPKDLATICMIGDIRPGVRVFETGLGSGALSMAMLRAGAHITGYEIREDFAHRAVSNVKSFLGEEPLTRYDVSIRDAYLGIEGSGFDRVIEVLHRTWHIEGQAVRPDHRMVAHTAFLTVARYLG